jgi:hypothetical protein
VGGGVFHPNASGIEIAAMQIALGLVVIAPAAALLYLLLAWRRLRRPKPLPPALSFFDVIGRPGEAGTRCATRTRTIPTT